MSETPILAYVPPHRRVSFTNPWGSPSATPGPSHKIMGPTIDMSEVCDHPGSTPINPRFLPAACLKSPGEFTKTGIPHLAGPTFVVNNVNGILWLDQFLALEHRFPKAYTAITKVAFPSFHWFSGVTSNRTNNPYVAFASRLPNLTTLTFNMHTAGITVSIYTERERMLVEQEDLAKSKQLRVMSLDEVIQFYDIDGLFQCTRIKTIDITCYESPIVHENCAYGDPVDMIKEVALYIGDGFTARRIPDVEVNVHVSGRERSE